MESNVRVRYGRQGEQTKNTMVTIRDGDTIFFGIARCRLSADKMDKEAGKKRAAIRANVARDNVKSSKLHLQDHGSVLVHKSGLFGNVNAENVLELLSYFENIDDIMLPDYLKSNVENT